MKANLPTSRVEHANCVADLGQDWKISVKTDHVYADSDEGNCENW